MDTSKIIKKNGKAYLVIEQEIIMNSKEQFEWAVHFEIGGWNSVFAETGNEAIKLAKKTWNFKIQKIELMTPETKQELCNNFY